MIYCAEGGKKWKRNFYGIVGHLSCIALLDGNRLYVDMMPRLHLDHLDEMITKIEVMVNTKNI